MISDFLVELFRFFNNLISRLPSRQIEKVVEIYDSLHRLIDETKVQRVLIFKAHNGGGFIKPDTPLYVSSLYEDYIHPLDSIRNDYQKMELDEDYVRMLRDLSVKKMLRINVKSLKAGLLKNSYARDGVTYAEMYYLCQNRKNLYFCSIVTTIEGENFDTPIQRSTISLVINNIKNNIR